MINLELAQQKLLDSFPECRIKKHVIHNGKYVFYAPTSDSLEGEMDPFYSVSMEDGQVEEFPIMLPENFSVIAKLS